MATHDVDTIRVEEQEDIPEGQEAEKMHLVYEDDFKSVHRSKTYERSLHTADLAGPFFITFFIACWALIIFIWYNQGWQTALVYFIVIVIINLFCMYLGAKSPYLRAHRAVEKKWKWY